MKSSALGAWLRGDCSRGAVVGVAIVSVLLLVPFLAWAKPYWVVLGALRGDWSDIWELAFVVALVCCPAVIAVVAVLAWTRLAMKAALPRWLVVVWALDLPAFVLVLLSVLFVFIASGGGGIAH